MPIFVFVFHLSVYFDNKLLKSTKRSVLLGFDNRCLKPDDSKMPENWDHYDPDDFYEATSKVCNIFKFILF